MLSIFLFALLPVQVGGLLYAIIGDQNTRIRTCGSLLRLLLPPDRGDIPKWVTVLGLADRLSHPVIFQHFDNRNKEVFVCRCLSLKTHLHYITGRVSISIYSYVISMFTKALPCNFSVPL